MTAPTNTHAPSNMAPDLDKARRFLSAHPAPGRLLLCGVTGAHFYGFPSPDSDIDLKGLHLVPTRSMLGLGSPAVTFDRLLVFEGVEHDLTTHDAGRAFELLLGGNGNVLERILTPLHVVESAEVRELQSLARGAICKRFIRHYRGFFGGVRREHDAAETPSAKTMLYSYRVALTGAHLLQTGELVGDLMTLAPRYGYTEVDELISHKAEHGEYAPLTAKQNARFRARWDDLEASLAEALEVSTLPEEAANRDAIERWLIDTRLDELG